MAILSNTTDRQKKLILQIQTLYLSMALVAGAEEFSEKVVVLTLELEDSPAVVPPSPDLRRLT